MIERWIEEPAIDTMSEDEREIFMSDFSDWLEEQADLKMLEEHGDKS